jgi:hypothetical protein
VTRAHVPRQVVAIDAVAVAFELLLETDALQLVASWLAESKIATAWLVPQLAVALLVTACLAVAASVGWWLARQVLARGDAVLSAENDSNGSRILCESLRNGSQWQSTAVWNDSVAPGRQAILLAQRSPASLTTVMFSVPAIFQVGEISGWLSLSIISFWFLGCTASADGPVILRIRIRGQTQITFWPR